MFSGKFGVGKVCLNIVYIFVLGMCLGVSGVEKLFDVMFSGLRMSLLMVVLNFWLVIVLSMWLMMVMLVFEYFVNVFGLVIRVVLFSEVMVFCKFGWVLLK